MKGEGTPDVLILSSLYDFAADMVVSRLEPEPAVQSPHIKHNRRLLPTEKTGITSEKLKATPLPAALREAPIRVEAPEELPSSEYIARVKEVGDEYQVEREIEEGTFNPPAEPQKVTYELEFESNIDRALTGAAVGDQSLRDQYTNWLLDVGMKQEVLDEVVPHLPRMVKLLARRAIKDMWEGPQLMVNRLTAPIEGDNAAGETTRISAPAPKPKAKPKKKPEAEPEPEPEAEPEPKPKKPKAKDKKDKDEAKTKAVDEPEPDAEVEPEPEPAVQSPHIKHIRRLLPTDKTGITSEKLKATPLPAALREAPIRVEAPEELPSSEYIARVKEVGDEYQVEREIEEGTFNPPAEPQKVTYELEFESNIDRALTGAAVGDQSLRDQYTNWLLDVGMKQEVLDEVVPHLHVALDILATLATEDMWEGPQLMVNRLTTPLEGENAAGETTRISAPAPKPKAEPKKKPEAEPKPEAEAEPEPKPKKKPKKKEPKPKEPAKAKDEDAPKADVSTVADLPPAPGSWH